ncbi:MAG: hypothetical protein MJ137_01910 [Clostridia bacterium]|nr:hypothetical protein [Clostridia bacterium]
MLKRAAELIQIGVGGRKAKNGESFDITSCGTVVVCNAASLMNTAFMSVPVVGTGKSKGVIGFDFSAIGEGKQKIVYSGILSY